MDIKAVKKPHDSCGNSFLMLENCFEFPPKEKATCEL